jgi:UDP-N-acetylglucosamine transferase subunit ALG13
MQSNSIGVYIDADQCISYFKTLGSSLNLTLSLYRDADDFLGVQEKIKYAAFRVPYSPKEHDWLDRVEKLYSASDYMFIFCTELHEHTASALIALDKPKVVIFVCGHINYEFKHANVYKWMSWFYKTSVFYREDQPNLLRDKLEHHQNKDKVFDILLGGQRQHRDYVYNFVNNNNLQDKVIMTYHKFWDINLRNTEFIFEEEGLEFLPDHNYNYTIQDVKYYNKAVTLSCIVPFKVYNESYYSLVTETNAVNEFNFYTEKIVKPILGKRLFIIIAGKGYLKQLHELGFKTFSSIIDETYDEIDDHQTRWSMALNEMSKLIHLDPVEIYSNIQDIVDHNQKLMLTTQWNTPMFEALEDITQEMLFAQTKND